MMRDKYCNKKYNGKKMSKLLPSINKNENILSPNILLLNVYKDEITDEDPSFMILLEKKEVKTLDNFTLDTLTISYSVLNMYGSGRFGASYNKRTDRVSITSESSFEGAIFLDPQNIRGYRIGTYIMNQIISWAKHNYSSAKLDTIFLYQPQASPENKERRNHFYEQFGIKFNYSNDKKEEGISCPIKINRLNTVETWKKNIREEMIIDCITDMAETIKDQRSEIRDLSKGNKLLSESVEYYLKENIFQYLVRNIKYSFVRIVEILVILLIFLLAIKNFI